jgi:hypothetical protein
MNDLRKFLLLTFCAGLVGCDATKDFLGLNQETPDAFAVVEHAPLEMPPEFNLRPPQPGAKRMQEVTPTQQAQKYVFSQVSQKEPRAHPRKTQAETRILQQAHTDQGQANIRHIIHKENRAEVEDNQTFMQKLSLTKKAQPASDVIDPVAEKARFVEEGIAS